MDHAKTKKNGDDEPLAKVSATSEEPQEEDEPQESHA